MNKYIYAIFADGIVKLNSVTAVSYTDARNKIAKKYFDKYDELEDDSYKGVVGGLRQIYDIYMSELRDIEEF